MAITMQGSWTLRVTARNAAFPQRFVVTGADSGNGVHDGSVGTTVFVSGRQWSVDLQHRPTAQPWRSSAQRIDFPSVSGGLVRFAIRADDAGGDADFDDLVLGCSLPASSADTIVYGTAKTYAGRCLFNPCRDDLVVVDPPFGLADLCERFPPLCDVVAKLHPERLRLPRIPHPDPPPDAAFAELAPLVLPTGLPPQPQGLVFRSKAAGLRATAARPAKPGAMAPIAATALGPLGPGRDEPPARPDQPGRPDPADRAEAELVAALKTTVHRAPATPPLAAGLDRLDRADLEALAALRDVGIRFHCDVDPAPGLLLRVQEYDRTAAEKLGGPYTGTGAREDLGYAVTDEQGRYLLRFTRGLDDIAAEVDDTTADEALATALRPDVIVQVLGTGLTPTWETAAYANVPNLRRIDLCIPHASAHPSRDCVGDRVIQRIGDIVVLHAAVDGSPNTLDAEGRITCRNANAPQVDCAAWRGGLRLYACFGRPEALHYALYFRRPGEPAWRPVSQPHALNWIPNLVAGGTSVGPTNRGVTPGVPLVGGPQPVPTYDSHEGDLNWIENDLKLVLSTALYRPADEPGPVQFRIEAYDAAGAVVPGTADTITLYLHDRTGIAGRPAKGEIASVTMGATTLGDCGLFVLDTPDAPLAVRLRAVDPEGFLHHWRLDVTRGNHVAVATRVVAGAAPKTHAEAPAPCDFTGTRDEPSADPQDWVVTTLQPGADAAAGASWLPPGHDFCSFAFTLRAADRVTDGRTAYPQSVFWQDLIGLSTAA